MTIKAQVMAAVVAHKLEHGQVNYVDASPQVFAKLVIDEAIQLKSEGAVLIDGIAIFLDPGIERDCIQVVHYGEQVSLDPMVKSITKIGLKDDDVE